MTTAGRPTFDTARGGQSRGDLSAMSKQYSSRDLPSHKKLKYRQIGQGTIEELSTRDFQKELEERDRGTKRPKITENNDEPKRKKPELLPARNLDADDPQEEDSDSSDDDENNEEDLLAELEKIKKEREMDREKQEVEKQRADEKIRMANILNGNPLLTNGLLGTEKCYSVKRRWNDDVVFKNCARNEPEQRKEFINDSLRSEFHKKFMNKYIQ